MANHLWPSPDFWVHLAAVRAFEQNLFDPSHPLIVGDAADPYLSPYTFVLGLVTRATDVSAVDVLAVAGVVNLVLLLLALRRFVACVSDRSSAATLTLLFTLAAWGVNPWRWSGFFNFNSLGSALPHSSTFTTAMGLFAVASLHRWMQTGRPGHLAVVGVLTPLVVLCHPMTAVWVGALAGAFVVADASRSEIRRVIAVLAVAGTGGLVALLWPYFPVASLAGSSATFENMLMYRRVLLRTFLAWPGLVLLGFRFRDRQRDPLFLGGVMMGGLYVAGYVTGNEVFGRVLPGIMLVAHTAMGVWAADALARWRTLATRTRGLVAAGGVAIFVVGAIAAAPGVVRGVPRGLLPARYANDERLESLTEPYQRAASLIGPDDVVVASRPLAIGVAASSGKVIAPPAPAPFVDDIPERRAAEATLLSPDTDATTRRELVDRYRVEWFVLTPSAAKRLRVVPEFGEQFDVVARTDDMVLLHTRASVP